MISVIVSLASAVTLRILDLSIDAYAQSAFLAALTTVADLVLAASVFVCIMAIQSPSEHLRRIRSLYSKTFSAVWIHILSAFSCPALSLLSCSSLRPCHSSCPSASGCSC